MSTCQEIQINLSTYQCASVDMAEKVYFLRVPRFALARAGAQGTFLLKDRGPRVPVSHTMRGLGDRRRPRRSPAGNMLWISTRQRQVWGFTEEFSQRQFQARVMKQQN